MSYFEVVFEKGTAKVEKPVLFNYKTKEVYDLPFTVNGEIDWFDWYLGLKCSAIVETRSR